MKKTTTRLRKTARGITPSRRPTKSLMVELEHGKRTLVEFD